MTAAINERLPMEHLQFIVEYLLNHQEQLTDYLQVFQFYIEDKEQWLIQRQEQPDCETTIFVVLEETKPINEKVWVMDQQDYVMILFPSCY